MNANIKIKTTLNNLFVMVDATTDNLWSTNAPSIEEIEVMVPEGKVLRLLDDEGNVAKNAEEGKLVTIIAKFDLVTPASQKAVVEQFANGEERVKMAKIIHQEWMAIELQTLIAKRYEKTGFNTGRNRGFFSGLLVGAAVAVGACWFASQKGGE